LCYNFSTSELGALGAANSNSSASHRVGLIIPGVSNPYLFSNSLCAAKYQRSLDRYLSILAASRFD
jgi:hypothetical protein